MNRKLTLSALVLFALLFGSCNKAGKPAETPSAPVADTESTEQQTLRIGVVSLDSLYAHYEYYTDTNKKLDDQAKRNQQRLASKAQQAQEAYANYMDKAQRGLFTSQDQVDTEEKRITNMQQEGVRLEQNLAQEMMDAQMNAQKALHEEVSKQLALFNADKKYDLILTSSGLEGVMYTTETLDITQEVLDFLNAAYLKGKEQAKGQK